ncbi:hypothetical protein V8C86DRAFT_1096302 [Haematococcus lacustris]
MCRLFVVSFIAALDFIAGDTYNLLILDPGTASAPLSKALRETRGWQRLLRRGERTLRHSQYQLLYCLDSMSSEEEHAMEKTIVAAEVHHT